MSKTYETIARHHTAHIYTKGANKGDAPLDKRSKTHLRVIKNSDNTYAVRFHNTDILTIEPSGSVFIDCDGWAPRRTTMSAVNDALTILYKGAHPWLCSRRSFSHSQLTLAYFKGMGKYEHYKYYDGISLDTDGNIQSELKFFQAKRIDKAKVAAFTADVVSSGFKDCFKLLHAAAEEGNYVYKHTFPPVTLVTSVEHADRWPQLINEHAFERTWSWQAGKRIVEKLPAPKVWANIMSACKKSMYEVVDTTVTVI